MRRGSTGRRLIGAAAGIMLAASVTLSGALPVHADVGCTHRGHGHWHAHGGLEDDRYHEMRGELPTCHDRDGRDDAVGVEEDVVDDAERAHDAERQGRDDAERAERAGRDIERDERDARRVEHDRHRL